MAKEKKSNKFRGRLITEWRELGKPVWSGRELLAMCLLTDFDLKNEGLNPAPTFRQHIQSGNYARALHWANGLKFSGWLK